MAGITAEELYPAYRDRVMRFFLSRLDSREDAEDLTSEVFLKVTRALSGFDAEKASLSTWLYTISRNVLTDHLRRKRAPEELSEEPYAEDQAEKRLVREETLRELAAALGRLERDQRDVVILRYYNGYPLTEIARRMGMSYGAVKLRHAKALEALRRDLCIEDGPC